MKIFITGLSILFAAIILNFLAEAVSFLTWYDVLTGIGFYGMTIDNYIFLFLVYPFVLGASAILISEKIK